MIHNVHVIHGMFCSYHQSLREKYAKGIHNWHCFSPDVRVIIEPCPTSAYIERDPLPPHVAIQHTHDDMHELVACFRTLDTSAKLHYEQATSLRTWLYQWTRALITSSHGTRRAIFMACRVVIRSDVETAMVLLPHLVENALMYGQKPVLTQIG